MSLKRSSKDVPDTTPGNKRVRRDAPDDPSQDREPVDGSAPEEILAELKSRNTDDELEVEEVGSESSSDSEEEEGYSTGDEQSEGEEDSDFDLEEQLKTLKEKDPVAHAKLEEVKTELERTEPSIFTLLATPLRVEDRAKLCQYYEIYKSSLPNTPEWLESRTRYNELFKEYKVGYQQHSQFTPEEHAKMKEEEERLTGFDPQLALKYRILNLETSRENKQVIYRRYEELLALESNNEEYSKLKHWLTWATSIPHDKIKKVEVTNITEFITEASKLLDKELFGMRKVKEQILLFLSAKLANPTMKRSNLALLGPPGVGKTAIARMIAEVMDWGFEQISFGGMDKADFLKGHEYTYVGAQPGEIAKCLKRMGHKNGVIFLDELEKAAEHPDVKAALLHLVDQSQNCDFKDNFLGEVSMDLSHLWYIGSMNSLPADQALADRWWVIKVDGYSNDEKVKIIRGYLLPKALSNMNMDAGSVTMDEETCRNLISRVCTSSDKGVRTVQKAISDLVNKIHFLVQHQDAEGKLPFLMSFPVGVKLQYPVDLTSSILLKLVDNKELDQALWSLYL